MWDRPRPGTYLRTLHWQADSYPLYHQGSPLTYRLCVLGTDLLSDYDLQIVLFYFLDNALWITEILNFGEVQYIFFFFLLILLVS